MRRTILVLVVICTTLVVPSRAEAATFTVTKSSDGNDGSCSQSDCSLREAVVAANAASGQDRIDLPTGSFFLSDTAAGDIDITSEIHIVGSGLGSVVSGVSGWADRIFDVSATGEAIFFYLTVTGGSSSAGGGLRNAGLLGFGFTDVIGNSSSIDGGGISNSGTLTVAGGTVSGNEAATRGGGIFNSGTVNMTASTLSRNRAGLHGGGMYSESGTISVKRSTVSGNFADDSGGGIRAASDVGPDQIVHTTIADNVADDNNDNTGGGGGLSMGAGTMVVDASIIADNTDKTSGSNDCEGVFSSGGHNVIEDATGCTNFTATGDTTGVNPLITDLAFRGGPTETHGIVSSFPFFSPAINRQPAADAGCSIVNFIDQRGLKRQGSGCDSGAYEIGFCKNNVINVIGTPFKEKLIGTNNADGIVAYGGDDKVFGLAGNDALCGGGGSDRLYGGEGDDFLKGEGGNDRCFGEEGNDTLKCETKVQD